MELKKILHKSIIVIMIVLSTVFSMVFAFSLFAFIFNFDDKGILQFFVIASVICTLLWTGTFLIASIDKGKSRNERFKEIKDIISKIPLILLSSVITTVYVLVYFFFFGFMTVSDYGEGGWGSDAGEALIYVFSGIAILIISIVMYKVFKTDKQDISLTIYNQFSVLKWSSLIALPFGIWSTYYFYHEEGTVGWIAMIVWSLILYFVYAMMKRISNKVHDSITDANLNRIIHEKKKKMINQEPVRQESIISESVSKDIIDELRKLHELVKDGILTNDEFEIQKQKLLKS